MVQMAKRNEEFNKWWQYWMSTLAQNRVVVRHLTSGNKPRAYVEPTVDIQTPASCTLRDPVTRMASFKARIKAPSLNGLWIKSRSGNSQLM
jgi:hypothetical protein